MAKANAGASVLGKLSLGNELVLGALIAELVGTFILTFAVLNTMGNAIVAALAVLVMVLVMSRVSGGHINPVVTVSLFATKQISLVKAVGYVIAQFLGAMLAVVVATQFLATSPATLDPYTQQAAQTPEIFKVPEMVGQWRPFFAEMLGATLFSFGVAAAWFGRKEGADKAFTIGGALLLGLIVATSGSSGILNPAVALAVGALDMSKSMWGVWAYLLAPVLGGALGATLYKLVQSDVMMGGTSKKKG